MDIFKTIEARASVREYQLKPIEKDILEKIVDAGRRAPSARGVEPWEFIVIRLPQTLNKISDLAQNGQFIKNASAAIVIVCSDTKYYLEDGCAATENILLAASESGIGSCWIAGDKKPYCAEILNILGVPKDKKLVSIISLGWPKEKPRQKKRRLLEEVIHWERF